MPGGGEGGMVPGCAPVGRKLHKYPGGVIVGRTSAYSPGILPGDVKLHQGELAGRILPGEYDIAHLHVIGKSGLQKEQINRP